MKIPKRFKLLGIEYTVGFSSPVDPARPNAWGMTNHRASTIIINSDIAPAMQEQTFLHELIHCVYFQMGLDSALNLNEQQEEIVVNAMANGLYAAIASKALTT